MHLQSSIVIEKDEKRRLKSDYMKRYNERMKLRKNQKKILNLPENVPAGTLSFIKNDRSEG